MENRQESNLDILETMQDSKIIGSEKKIKDSFIIKYIIIFLIPWTIYRLSVNFAQDKYFKDIFNFQFSLSSIEQFKETIINFSYKLLAFSIIVILLNFLIVFISSSSIFKKYKIKKEHIKNIMKVIIVIQLVFFGIHAFFFTVNYINNTDTNENYKVIYERLQKEQNNSKSNKNNTYIEYNVNDDINEARQNIKVHLAIAIILDIICTTLCVLLQKKILEANSV